MARTDETIIKSDINYQSSSDENLLSIVNDASLSLIGVVAQSDGIRPSKTELISKLNDIQMKFCNKRDWRFLRDVGTVAGYEVSDTEGMSKIEGGTSFDSTLFTSNVSTTDYVATKVSFTDLRFPNTIRALVGAAGSGFTTVIADTNVLICPDNGGTPDVDNPIATSAVVSFDGQPGSTAPTSGGKSSAATYEFNDTATIESVLTQNTVYWLVLKIDYDATNGDLAATLITNGSSVGMYKRSGDSTWQLSAVGPVWFEFNYYESEWLSELILSAQVQKCYRLYAGSDNRPSAVLLPWQDDKYVRRPADMPIDTFVERPYETNGQKKIKIYTSLQNIKTWYVEYKKKATALVNDSDVPLIPSPYRVLLKDKLTAHYMSLGYGMQEQGTLELLLQDIMEQEKNMAKEYLPSPPRAITPIRGGLTPFDDVYDVPNRSYVDLGVYHYWGSRLPVRGEVR